MCVVPSVVANCVGCTNSDSLYWHVAGSSCVSSSNSTGLFDIAASSNNGGSIMVPYLFPLCLGNSQEVFQ